MSEHLKTIRTLTAENIDLIARVKLRDEQIAELLEIAKAAKVMRKYANTTKAHIYVDARIKLDNLITAYELKWAPL